MASSDSELRYLRRIRRLALFALGTGVLMLSGFAYSGYRGVALKPVSFFVLGLAAAQVALALSLLSPRYAKRLRRQFLILTSLPEDVKRMQEGKRYRNRSLLLAALLLGLLPVAAFSWKLEEWRPVLAFIVGGIATVLFLNMVRYLRTGAKKALDWP
jgi:hypothetical protein